METEQINNLIVEEFAKTVEFFSISATEARLFSMLYLKKESMTLDQMSAVMEKSKTSMSTAIRSLLDLNLVVRVWKKGERKDWYQATDNLYEQFMTTYISRWVEAASRQRNSLTEINEMLTENKNGNEITPEARNSFQNRLEEIIAFHRLIEQAFKKIDADEAPSSD